MAGEGRNCVVIWGFLKIISDESCIIFSPSLECILFNKKIINSIHTIDYFNQVQMWFCVHDFFLDNSSIDSLLTHGSSLRVF